MPTLSTGDAVFLRAGTVLELPGNYTPGAHGVSFDLYRHPDDPPDRPNPVLTTRDFGRFVMWMTNLESVRLSRLRIVAPAGVTARPALRYSVTAPVAQGLTLEDCEIEGDDGALYADLSSDCTGFTVRGCSFRAARAQTFSFGRTGAVFIVATSGTRPFQVNGLHWRGNTVTHPQGTGMMVRSGSATDDNLQSFSGRFVNATFSSNRWEHCGVAGVFLICGFHSGARIADAADHYGWDGLLFEDNVIADNGGSGLSVGPNVRDTFRPTTIQRNRVVNNGHRLGTTGGLQLMGLSNALVQDNECTNNWTTSTFDGVNLFMDVWDGATSEMATTGAVGCVVRRNVCSGARGAGGDSYADWLMQQNPNSSNAPSSGIRLYFAKGNFVYGNLLVDNGSGMACDKSADNWIFNNTIVRCTMGIYDGVGLATRGNRFFNNVTHLCDWDIYGLGIDGWTPVAATTGVVRLEALAGTFVRMNGADQFFAVRMGVGARNFSVREAADGQSGHGLAVVSMKQDQDTVFVHVLRPFTRLDFAPGELLVGAMEAYRSEPFHGNARSGATVGALREVQPGPTDLTAAPRLDASHRPLADSPLLGRGLPLAALPDLPFGAPTDLAGRPFAAIPSFGAYDSPA